VTTPDKVLAAAKAAYPEFWPALHRAEDMPMLTMQRQAIIDRIGAALEAAEAHEPDAPQGLQTLAIVVPQDAAMVQQSLTVLAYLDHNGETAYSVQALGEGLMSSWLGMGVLAQDYLLREMRQANDEGDGD
jgi:hypothetical protein